MQPINCGRQNEYGAHAFRCTSGTDRQSGRAYAIEYVYLCTPFKNFLQINIKRKKKQKTHELFKPIEVEPIGSKHNSMFLYTQLN